MPGPFWLLRLAAAFAAAVGLAAVLAATGWRAEHFRDGDFIQYWLAGRALLTGADMYDPTVWRGLHDAIGSAGSEVAPGLGFLYPLPVALYALPFALLPLSLAGPLWLVAQGMTALIALIALGRRLFTRAPRRDLVLLLGLAVVMEPVFVIGNDGNITRFMIGIVGGGLALLLSGRPFTAGLLLGLAGVKPQLVLAFVPLLVLFCPRVLRLRLVAGGLVTIVASALVTTAFRPAWIGEWVSQALGARGEYGRLNVWGLVPAGSAWLAWLIVSGALVAIIWWWRTFGPDLARSASAALGLSVFVAPYAADYDLAVLLVGVPAVLATIATFPSMWRAAFIAVLIVTSPALVLLAALGLVDQAALFIPPVALVALVIGTQLLGRRVGSPNADRT